jgi:hypothetical protein
MAMRRLIGATLAVASWLAGAPAWAEPTTVTVRALSKDAKFIGTGMGGVKIRLIDARNGKVLAEGVTAGGTGDTDRLVVQPRVRQQKLSGEGDAAFTATLDIAEPTLVTLEARGPKDADPSIMVASTAWILPGQPVVGDGWVVEFPGLVVGGTVGVVQDVLTLTASVKLMCGCPVTPGGLWDADHYEVIAWIGTEDQMKPYPMTYAGQPSTFQLPLTMVPRGKGQTVRITAVDKRSGNTGVGTLYFESDFGP